jgi:hypothetical protein
LAKLEEELGLKRPGPLPPKFQPKLSIRVSCGRTKQVAEFAIDVPIEGFDETALSRADEKLSDIFRRIGILPAKPAKERDDAEGNLQAEEESQAGPADDQGLD